MGKIVLIIIAFILVTIGVICIFDARKLTKKLFSFGDQNEGSMGMKMLGFIMAIASALIIFFQMK